MGFFNQTALFAAVKKRNIDLVKFLLSNDKIDVNAMIILILVLYLIQNYIF